ncbi:hypothetical protein EDB19DRAFT_1350261 [Suillus lakei]|nr:hypothetical protein EDB19DRAFT_1350261 [Suillus lakei]
MILCCYLKVICKLLWINCPVNRSTGCIRWFVHWRTLRHQQSTKTRWQDQSLPKLIAGLSLCQTTLSRTLANPKALWRRPIWMDQMILFRCTNKTVDAVSESLQDEPPELCAISESSFNGNEELQRPMTSVVNENALAAPIGAQVVGSDHHEPPAPQQGASTGSQDVQNTQTTFPTLGQFTAPVPGLPQLPSMGASQYHPPQPPAVPQAPLQGYGWSQNGHYVNHYPDRQYIPYPQPPAVPQAPLQGRDWSQHAYYVNPFPDGRYNHYPQPPAIPQAPPQGPGWPQHGYQAGYYAGASNAGPSTHNAGPSAHNAGPSAHPQPYTAVVPPGTYYPNVAFSQGQNAHLQTGPSGGTQLVSSSSAPDGTASVKSRKRKAQPVDAQDGSSGSSLVQKPRKRRRPDDKEIKEGKFGVYSLADASAIVMARPVHDPKPFDGERRTHDASGNVLRTRTFGVMELDDSYPDTSVAITRDLPTDLTCVRSCDWTDQPCGLFVEMNMARIEDHLFHWHGVKLKTKTPCEVEGCKDPDPMVNLGRHIEGIHYATTYQCPYCEKLLSRPDSLKRHVCPPLTVSMTTVEGEGRVFHPLDAKKMVYGYIVPAREAT